MPIKLHNLDSYVPVAAPGLDRGFEAADAAMRADLFDPSDFAFGCIDPFELDRPVTAKSDEKSSSRDRRRRPWNRRGRSRLRKF